MATDGLEPNRDGFSCRIRAGRHPITQKGLQLRVTICVRDRAVALARKRELERMSRLLCDKALTLEAAFLIKKAAAQSDEAAFRLCVESGLRLSPEPARSSSKTPRTFKDLGEMWTTGKLAELYPAYVKAKASSADDESRLGWLYQTIGDVPLAEFTLAEAMLAMGNLPPTCRRPATQRQYAQCIARVLRFAVFPCQVLSVYPLPKGFLPKLVKGDVLFPYLYPDEELRMLSHADPATLPLRMFFGTLNREGMRVEEALGLRWRLLDRDNGVMNVTTRKNGRAASWPAAEGTLDALWALRDQTKDGPFEKLPHDDKYAARLRKLLSAAGVDRHALHYNEDGRRRLRAHDLRATFVTLALAAGRSENWVSTRTGHMSSGQVNGYKRQMESAIELGHTEFLVPLDVALGLRVLADGPAPDEAPPSSTHHVPSRVGENAGPGVTKAVTGIAAPGGEPRGVASETLGNPRGSEGRGRTGTPLRAADFECAVPLQDAQNPGVSGAGTCPSGQAVTAPGPTSGQHFLDQLRAAAHAAVQAGNWAAVAELGKLIDGAEGKAAAGTARAPAEAAPAPSSAGTSALGDSVAEGAKVVRLSGRLRRGGT